MTLKAQERQATGRRPATHAMEERELARNVLRLLRGDWLEGEWTAEAKRFVPTLLVGVYLAHLEGRRLSKREASTIMNADPSTSGPKYIKLAEEMGLIEVERRPAEDKRKDFLVPTTRLNEILHDELNAVRPDVVGYQATQRPGDELEHGFEGATVTRRKTGQRIKITKITTQPSRHKPKGTA